ncbi:hypothetical protein DFH11DRAFT_190187 [Phellopilus nigrolimitatus]|nr:hypothetical protein DFH11DRAFT_190187 [Phellopilus nigrolimitatus]
MLVTIPVFDSITHHETGEQYANTLRDKRSLALVCKWWHDNTREFLYEDVCLRHGAETLADLFEQSKRDCPLSLGYGRYVRKISLPLVQYRPSDPVHVWARKEVTRVIKCCPNLLVLSRYRDQVMLSGHDQESRSEASSPVTNEESGNDIHLDSAAIRRIDWDNGPKLDMPRTVAVAPCATWLAQSLEVLSLSGENYLWPPDVLERMSVVRLPRVHTLRVATLCAFGIRGIYHYRMELPALRRIVLDRAEALYQLLDGCLRVWGPQVRAIEIGRNPRFLLSDYLSTLVKFCPNVETLHYPIFWAKVLGWRSLLEMPDFRFRSLRLVGLHAFQNTNVEFAGEPWQQIEGHFNALLGEHSKFPSIQNIKLHGMEWATLVSDVRFQNVLRLADIRGAEISCENRTAALALEEAKFENHSKTLSDRYPAN